MKNFYLLKFLALILLLFSALPAAAQVKIGILSTQFVLEQKFKLMEQAAKKQGVALAWTQVDRDGEAGVISHLANYAAPELKQKLAAVSGIDRDVYDWSINAISNG